METREIQKELKAARISEQKLFKSLPSFCYTAQQIPEGPGDGPTPPVTAAKSTMTQAHPLRLEGQLLIPRVLIREGKPLNNAVHDSQVLHLALLWIMAIEPKFRLCIRGLCCQLAL